MSERKLVSLDWAITIDSAKLEGIAETTRKFVLAMHGKGMSFADIAEVAV